MEGRTVKISTEVYDFVCRTLNLNGITLLLPRQCTLLTEYKDISPNQTMFPRDIQFGYNIFNILDGNTNDNVAVTKSLMARENNWQKKQYEIQQYVVNLFALATQLDVKYSQKSLKAESS